jgi:hypothetical protein
VGQLGHLIRALQKATLDSPGLTPVVGSDHFQAKKRKTKIGKTKIGKTKRQIQIKTEEAQTEQA